MIISSLRWPLCIYHFSIDGHGAFECSSSKGKSIEQELLISEDNPDVALIKHYLGRLRWKQFIHIMYLPSTILVM